MVYIYRKRENWDREEHGGATYWFSHVNVFTLYSERKKKKEMHLFPLDESSLKNKIIKKEKKERKKMKEMYKFDLCIRYFLSKIVDI